MTMRKHLLFILFLLFTFYALRFTPAFAQTTNPTSAPAGTSQGVEGAATLGVANMIAVKDPNVKDGSVLSASPKGAILSTTPYDSQVIGVVSRDAGIILSSNDGGNSVPVISNVIVYVLFSTQQG